MSEQFNPGHSSLSPGELVRLESAYAAMALKDEPRRGWVQHGVSTPESVAAHSWGTAYLCLLFADSAAVDRSDAVAMAVLHDLAEAQTGDFAARLDASDRDVGEAVKRQLEERAIDGLLPPGLATLRELWDQYESRANRTALFVRDMNLIDMCLQALRYESLRRYDASVLVPSTGAHRNLDEFFLGAAARLHSQLAKGLFGEIRDRYELSKQPL